MTKFLFVNEQRDADGKPRGAGLRERCLGWFDDEDEANEVWAGLQRRFPERREPGAPIFYHGEIRDLDAGMVGLQVDELDRRISDGMPDDGSELARATRYRRHVRNLSGEPTEILVEPKVLRLHRDTDRITLLTGKVIEVTPDAAHIIRVLIEAQGERVAGDGLRITSDGERPDRIIKRMPAELRKLIESKASRGGGTRLTVPGVVT